MTMKIKEREGGIVKKVERLRQKKRYGGIQKRAKWDMQVGRVKKF